MQRRHVLRRDMADSSSRTPCPPGRQHSAMSTAPAPANIPAGTPPAYDNKVTVISHSNLFYWWPVWAVGFLMAALTYMDHDLLATVPPGTKAAVETTYAGEKREAYVLPEGKHVSRVTRGDPKSATRDPYIHMARS